MVSRALQGKQAAIIIGAPVVPHSNVESIESILENLIVAGNGQLHGERDLPTETFRFAVTVIEIIADMFTVGAGVFFAEFLYRRLSLGKNVRYSALEIGTAAVFMAACFVLMLYKDDAYNAADGLLRVKETERVLRASCTVFMLILPVTFFAAFQISRWLTVVAFLIVPSLLLIEKFLVHMGLRWIRMRGHGVKKVLIYGAGITGRRVFSAIVRSPKLGLNPVAFVDDNPALTGTFVSALGYKKTRSVAEVLKGPLSPDLVGKLGADHVIIAIPSLHREAFIKTAGDLLVGGISVSFVPNHLLPLDSWLDHTDMDGLLLASFRRINRSAFYDAFKRAFDICAAGILLVLFSPIMLIIAALIRKSSPGPALFKQERVGKDGKLFRMYKYRSMYTESLPYETSPSDPSDPRITPIGRFIRKTSLDELPQLINVLKGEMSLVGPRPEMAFIVNEYRPLHRQRLLVKPGITGLWQLSADRDYHIHENIEYDLYYIRNQNVFMDISILVHTAFFALRGV